MTARRGRPPKLTARLITNLSNSVRSGAYLETAAAFAGIAAVTLREWLRKGARIRCDYEENNVRPVGHDNLLYELSIEMEKSMAAAAMRHVLNIAKHAENEWTASAWWLERRYPDQWGRRNRLDIGGVEGAPPIRTEGEVGLVVKVVEARDPRQLREQPEPFSEIPAPEAADDQARNADAKTSKGPEETPSNERDDQ